MQNDQSKCCRTERQHLSAEQKVDCVRCGIQSGTTTVAESFYQHHPGQGNVGGQGGRIAGKQGRPDAASH